jgi:hypothetical protein
MELVQGCAIAASVLLLAAVGVLVRRRKLTEEHSLIWIAVAVLLLLLSLSRDVLHVAARLVGIHYPPALLLLALTAFVFLVSLYFSVVISRQRQQIERLIEDLALLDAQVRALHGSRGTVAAGEVIPGSTRDGGESSQPRRLAGQERVRGVQRDDYPAA